MKYAIVLLVFLLISPSSALLPKDEKGSVSTTNVMNHSRNRYVVYGFLPYWISSSYVPQWGILTHLAWFGESVSSTGEVSSSHPIPSSILEEGKKRGVKICLTITCFNGDSIDSILANYMDNAVRNIVNKVVTYKADGVCIDFEGIRKTNSISGASNRVLYEKFMEKLYNAVKAVNSSLHVSLCAPAVDWNNIFRNSNLSRYVDSFLIMGYDYFWSGSQQTGPVAPLEGYTYDLTYTVNTYLNYIASNKIVLLLPFYGREWPCVSDSPGAQTTGEGISVIMRDAVEKASIYGRRWHSVSSTPWYAYTSGSAWRQCWYDDVESLNIKYNLVIDRGLQGGGMWALGYEDWNVWPMIAKKFGGRVSLAGKKIAIDPGHGGHDAGAVGYDGSEFPNEKDFNLDICLRLKELLSYADATVIMTRSSDVYVSLEERCNIANNANADIFVSVHMNSAPSTAAHGTETYYYAVSSTQYSVEGKRLAENIQQRVVARLGTYDRGAKGDYPTLGYHLYVLKYTTMPAALVEVCFISNPSNFELISKEFNRTLAALGIYEGICKYFGIDPIYGNSTIDIRFPSYGSSVTGTVNCLYNYINSGLLTKCRWKIENDEWKIAYEKVWFFSDAQQASIKFNTYLYPVGWKTLYVECEHLFGDVSKISWRIFFTRNLAFEAKVWGSPTAINMIDDNDDNYAGNDLNKPFYIQLKCNHTIRAIKTHWWDGDNRYYQYKIEISRDNKTWIEVVNKTSGEWRSWQWDPINASARYIRITGTYNSANRWYHIKELQIFGRFDTPLTIYGYVKNPQGSVIPNITLLIINLNTNRSIISNTNALGYFEVELNDLGFKNGDRIAIRVLGNNSYEIFTVDDTKTSIFLILEVEILKEIRYCAILCLPATIIMTLIVWKCRDNRCHRKKLKRYI